MFQKNYSVEELCYLLCYPKPSRKCLGRRIVEARLLGVKRFVREGFSLLGGVPIIGKGTTALVLKAEYIGGLDVAVKVRRIDSNRFSMRHEAKILYIVNKVGIGPRMVAYSRNFIVWEYVEGASLDEWVNHASLSELKEVVAKLLVQLYILDRIGISHKELARSRGHILIAGESPVIMDFESASLSSKKSNVTQFFSSIISGRGAGRTIRESLKVNIEELRGALALYKVERDVIPVARALRVERLFHRFYNNIRSGFPDALDIADKV